MNDDIKIGCEKEYLYVPTKRERAQEKIEEIKEKSGGNVFHIQQTINAEIRLLKELLEERVEEHDGK